MCCASCIVKLSTAKFDHKMRISLCTIFLCIFFLSTVQGASMPWLELKNAKNNQDSKHWAVLVAGSAGYDNYRHQADACHAYHIVRSHGIPSDQIITMMMDDIANNERNPHKGEIINRPNGTNVYSGVKIDYSHKDVTPENFLNVLKGKSVDGKPVLKSGPNDYVFVNFVDHGAKGLIGFPNSVLKAKPLIDALNYMHSQKMFKKLVFYLEACESGSMFKNLLSPNIEIFATTAANEKESSYACYYDKERHTYLGDVYSVKWMEDTDKEDINTETLAQQFAIVKRETNTSHVQEYGDMTIAQDHVGEYQGKQNTRKIPPYMKGTPKDAVPQEDVPMQILKHMYQQATSLKEKQAILLRQAKLMERQRKVKEVIRSVLEKAANGHKSLVSLFYNINKDISNYGCYDTVIDFLHSKCFNLGQVTEAYKHLYALSNACEAGISTRKLVESIQAVCPAPIQVPEY